MKRTNKKYSKRNEISTTTQLELDLPRPIEKDRNFDRGGRSFYFFDFDDNIATLSSTTYVFHKETGDELALPSAEFVEHSEDIGDKGPYAAYELRFDNKNGTFRNFRDKDLNVFDRLMRRKQVFVEDLRDALRQPDFHWKGPSWPCFYHAVFNRRPISLITARGHSRQTLKDGIRHFIKEKHLPDEPNYLSLFPVSNDQVQQELGFSNEISIPKLKQAAIRASVEKAFDVYGESPYHRFGMSDDDPKNIELIVEEMVKLKRDFPNNSFFVIETHKGQFLKREVFVDHTETIPFRIQQMSLFQRQ